ncbi:MAG: type VI secretion system tube protein Hcp [Sterolibacteriaceae bacterium]|jgi:type VI secretion system secreted protein Hcp|nr:type VI secretion system tube protein Hcp [Sterolibacteriaceae bacterium]
MAVDFFLKISGIEGESADSKHKKEIDVLSWSWGANNSGSMAIGGGGGSGVVNMHDFSFTMKMSNATPKLMLACATGEHIKDVKLSCRKAGKEQQDYLVIKFSDVLVSSYQTGGSEGTEIPIESISLNFAKVEMEYKEQQADGTLGGAVTAGYDLKQKKKV